MAKYIVEQSAPLRGEVTVSGSKTAVLPILAATILSEGVCEIKTSSGSINIRTE